MIDLNIGKALVAGAGFSSWTYRPGFDVSLPVFSPLAAELHKIDQSVERKWFVVAAQVNLHPDYERELSMLPDLVQFHMCNDDPSTRCYQGKIYRYPNLLQVSDFYYLLKSELKSYNINFAFRKLHFVLLLEEPG